MIDLIGRGASLLVFGASLWSVLYNTDMADMYRKRRDNTTFRASYWQDYNGHYVKHLAFAIMWALICFIGVYAGIGYW